MPERVRNTLLYRLLLLALLLLVAGACSKKSDSLAGPENTVKVVLAGTGAGHVRCTYGTIDCPTACGPYDWSPGATVPLVAEEDTATSVFAGWSGSGCSGSSDTCYVVVAGHMVVTATFNLK